MINVARQSRRAATTNVVRGIWKQISLPLKQRNIITFWHGELSIEARKQSSFGRGGTKEGGKLSRENNSIYSAKVYECRRNVIVETFNLQIRNEKIRILNFNNERHKFCN